MEFGFFFFFFQAEDGIRYWSVTGVQTCALPISGRGQAAGRQGGDSPHAEARQLAEHGRDRIERPPAPMLGPALGRPRDDGTRSGGVGGGAQRHGSDRRLAVYDRRRAHQTQTTLPSVSGVTDY